MIQWSYLIHGVPVQLDGREQDPLEWFELRGLKQQLVIGTEGNPWMAAPLGKIREPLTPPQIAQTGPRRPPKV